MNSPLEEFAHLRRTVDAAPAGDSVPLSVLETANLVQRILRKRDANSTPFGILTDPEPFERLQRRAENAIRNCKSHRPPNCQCWSSTRNWLWNARKRYPAQSPEAWTAVRIWTELEEAEQRGKNAS